MATAMFCEMLDNSQYSTGLIFESQSFALSTSRGNVRSRISQVFKELPAILWKFRVHYNVHKMPPLAPILSQMDPIHNSPSYFFNILLILSFHLRPGLPSVFFPSGFPTKTSYAFLISPMTATRPLHLTAIDLITLMFGENESYVLPLAQISHPHISQTSLMQCYIILASNESVCLHFPVFPHACYTSGKCQKLDVIVVR